MISSLERCLFDRARRLNDMVDAIWVETFLHSPKSAVPYSEVRDFAYGVIRSLYEKSIWRGPPTADEVIKTYEEGDKKGIFDYGETP